MCQSKEGLTFLPIYGSLLVFNNRIKKGVHMNKLPSVKLAFREGTSDKVYNAAVEEAGNGLYVVNFEYGRRCGTLNTGSKTQTPVTLDEATKVYENLVKSKTAKGYKVTGSGDGISSSVATIVLDRDQRDTGLRPQLLNPITEDEAETYLLNDDWCAQEKFDGKRMTIRKTDSEVIAANRKGLSIGFPDKIAEAFQSTPSLVADGEAVGEVLNVFDLLEAVGGDLRDKPYRERLESLKTLVGSGTKATVVAKTAIGQKDKRALMAELKAANKEGIVFKKLSAKWYAGRPASGGSAIKCKFWTSASVVVASHTKGKHSIGVRLGERDMGNVTIAQAIPLPGIGSIVEIRYLYVTGVDGKFYQPNFLGTRDDVAEDECTVDKQHIKYKPEAED